MQLVISTSLNPNSRSRILAKHVHHVFQKNSVESDFVDLSEAALPRCDGKNAYSDPAVVKLNEQVNAAQGIVMATPIYNYSIGSEAKNMIELTGQSWKDSVAGFLCAAGGQGSYMAVMHLANSLMLDFHTFILPRFVYATGNAFAGENITDNDLLDRLEKFSNEMARVTIALKAV